MSSSAPSSPCWLRKVSQAQHPGPQAPFLWPLGVLELTVVLGRAGRASAPDLRLQPVESQLPRHPTACSKACVSPQACWPIWWSRTSQCGGARGSALAGSTSSGSRTGGNAPVPIRPSASEDCWPDPAFTLAAWPSPGPSPALSPSSQYYRIVPVGEPRPWEWEPSWDPRPRVPGPGRASWPCRALEAAARAEAQ